VVAGQRAYIADLPYEQIGLRNGKLIDHPYAANPRPMSAAKIAQHTAAIKAFSNLYLCKIMANRSRNRASGRYGDELLGNRASPRARTLRVAPSPSEHFGPVKTQ
jgi:hypothetical protein